MHVEKDYLRERVDALFDELMAVEILEELRGVGLYPVRKLEELPAWERRAYGVWKGLVGSTASLEKRFKTKVKSIFKDMQGRALAHLEDGDTSGLLAEGFQKERGRLQRETRGLYKDALRAGIVNLGREVGAEIREDGKSLTKETAPIELPPELQVVIDVDWQLNDPVVLNYLELKESRIMGLADTIQRQIQQELAVGVAGGETLNQLSKRVRKVFSMADTRAQTIARTEVFGSSNFGRDKAMRTTSFKKKVWYTARDERVRSAHVGMNGKKIGMNESWTMPDGAVLRHPGDYEAGSPGNTINCRCLVTIDPDSHPALE